jgi:hypothetical protein
VGEVTKKSQEFLGLFPTVTRLQTERHVDSANLPTSPICHACLPKQASSPQSNHFLSAGDILVSYGSVYVIHLHVPHVALGLTAAVRLKQTNSKDEAENPESSRNRMTMCWNYLLRDGIHPKALYTTE